MYRVAGLDNAEPMHGRIEAVSGEERHRAAYDLRDLESVGGHGHSAIAVEALRPGNCRLLAMRTAATAVPDGAERLDYVLPDGTPRSLVSSLCEARRRRRAEPAPRSGVGQRDPISLAHRQKPGLGVLVEQIAIAMDDRHQVVAESGSADHPLEVAPAAMGVRAVEATSGHEPSRASGTAARASCACAGSTWGCFPSPPKCPSPTSSPMRKPCLTSVQFHAASYLRRCFTVKFHVEQCQCCFTVMFHVKRGVPLPGNASACCASDKPRSARDWGRGAHHLRGESEGWGR